MKNKKKSKKYEVVWTCDFCGQEFKTKKESDNHELTCFKNPQNREITLKIKIPEKQKIFSFLILFFVIYFLVFLLVDSYAQTNGLKEKNLFNPTEWFSSEVEDEIIPTIIPTPTVTPIPTTKPKVQTKNTNTNNVNNNQIECIGPDGKQFWTTMDECRSLNEKWGKPVDYITNCNVHADCGGGTQKMELSKCNNMTCCQYSDKSWHYVTKSTCEKKQSSGGGGNSGQSTYKITIPGGQEKICRAEGMEDISTYMKLMTQYIKEYSATGSESSLDMGIEAEKKYYEAIARYCTP